MTHPTIAFLILILSLIYSSNIFGQSTITSFDDVIDSSDAIVIARVVADSMLSKYSIDSTSNKGQYGINTQNDGNMYSAKIEKVFLGKNANSEVRIILLRMELSTEVEPAIIKRKHRYLFLLRKNSVSEEFRRKYGLGSGIFYSPTFGGSGVIDEKNSKEWKKAQEQLRKRLAAIRRIMKPK